MIQKKNCATLRPTRLYLVHCQICWKVGILRITSPAPLTGIKYCIFQACTSLKLREIQAASHLWKGKLIPAFLPCLLHSAPTALFCRQEIQTAIHAGCSGNKILFPGNKERWNQIAKKKLTLYEDYFCDGNEIFSKSKRMHKITSNCFRDTECLQELKLAINFQLGL